MTILTWDKNDARLKWRALVDTVASGAADVVITDQDTPVVAIISYTDFVAVNEALDDLRAAKRADAAFEEYLRDPSTAVPWEAIRSELIAEGKLDEESSPSSPPRS